MAITQEVVRQVWLKAEPQGSENEQRGFRKDQCGAWMLYSEYGNRNNKYGWEIDHIKPVSEGGTDALSNLRPLHWRNNAAKSDGKLSCAVISQGNDNVMA